eukprot:TRINITY_DN1944_c0_g1_i13.p2 TRINITY_DN1944_c0_g1~~TRINITY_DN1944_c0_g1_i13.p2  ORF type:complete len:112 (+),score=5.26 TRINITY_DN1944_c0_g1_i13:498-833(+)
MDHLNMMEVADVIRIMLELYVNMDVLQHVVDMEPQQPMAHVHVIQALLATFVLIHVLQPVLIMEHLRGLAFAHVIQDTTAQAVVSAGEEHAMEMEVQLCLEVACAIQVPMD